MKKLFLNFDFEKKKGEIILVDYGQIYGKNKPKLIEKYGIKRFKKNGISCSL